MSERPTAQELAEAILEFLGGEILPTLDRPPAALPDARRDERARHRLPRARRAAGRGRHGAARARCDDPRGRRPAGHARAREGRRRSAPAHRVAAVPRAVPLARFRDARQRRRIDRRIARQTRSSIGSACAAEAAIVLLVLGLAFAAGIGGWVIGTLRRTKTSETTASRVLGDVRPARRRRRARSSSSSRARSATASRAAAASRPTFRP